MNVTVKPLAVDIQTAGQMIGVSDGTIKMLIRTSETSGFPKPKKLSANRVGIIVKELEAWVDTRPESDLLPQKQPNERPDGNRPPPPPAPPRKRTNMDGQYAPYPGMATSFEAHTGQSWSDPDWRAETAMWAAAWKAALLHNAKLTGGGETTAEAKRDD